MKISTLIAASLIAAVPALAIADDDHTTRVIGSHVEKRLSLDEKALNACTQQFIAKILPGSQIQVRMVDSTRGQTVFRGAADPFYSKQMMVVDLSASTRTGSLLATANCRVNSRARVASLKTAISDADALVGLAVNDLRLKVVIR